MKNLPVLVVHTIIRLAVLVLLFAVASANSQQGFDGDKLKAVLAAQPAEVKARYVFRHPYETLAFFDIAPGETVLEALPGGGWYSNILRPYLGKEGVLIGVDYDYDMWAHFPWVNEGFLKKRRHWYSNWQKETQQRDNDDLAAQQGFTFSTLPDSLTGQVDTVLFIRALHNFARFNEQGRYLDTALSEAFRLLKPGGTLGIVQHQAPAQSPVDGSTGYLTKDFVISAAEAAGFVLRAESAINENPLDQPSPTDRVWRLPPSLATSKGDKILRQQMQKMGESNRMTLAFIKPDK